MLALRLTPNLEKRLEALAEKTGRTRSYLLREAILWNIDDIDDFHLAMHRMKRGGKRITVDQLECDLGPD